VVWRKTKMGFPFPYDRFQEESRPIMDMILARANNRFLDLSQGQSLKSNWSAMSFILWYELWFNENIDLLLEVQRMGALRCAPAAGNGFTPEYLNSRRTDDERLLWARTCADRMVL
jgi:asparagine synthase (glutamine-hydrolysing)